MIDEETAGIGSLFPGLRELGELYQALDQEVGRFKKAAALDCLKFCRNCCATDEARIEVSVFECLPLSIHLWKLGEAESYLQIITSSGEEGSCVLSRPAPFALPGWGCRHYAWRPLICRLFGFSAVLDKHGRARIALCRTLKEAEPQAEARINRQMGRGLAPLIIPHWAWKTSSLNPHLGQRRYPINQALRLALEKVGLRLHLLRNEEKKDRA